MKKLYHKFIKWLFSSLFYAEYKRGFDEGRKVKSFHSYSKGYNHGYTRAKSEYDIKEIAKSGILSKEKLDNVRDSLNWCEKNAMVS